jgi:hypothetical protein
MQHPEDQKCSSECKNNITAACTVDDYDKLSNACAHSLVFLQACNKKCLADYNSEKSLTDYEAESN